MSQDLETRLRQFLWEGHGVPRPGRSSGLSPREHHLLTVAIEAARIGAEERQGQIVRRLTNYADGLHFAGLLKEEKAVRGAIERAIEIVAWEQKEAP